MKRFVTIFATLVMGATLFTTAMAQGKPAAPTAPVKKPVVAHAVKKKALAKHTQKVALKTVAAKKVVAQKASGKSEKSVPKGKAKRVMARTVRTRTGHSTTKATGKRSTTSLRTPIRSNARPRMVNNGIVKSPTAPKAGKVVNQQ